MNRNRVWLAMAGVLAAFTAHAENIKIGVVQGLSGPPAIVDFGEDETERDSDRRRRMIARHHVAQAFEAGHAEQFLTSGFGIEGFALGHLDLPYLYIQVLGR